MKNLELEDLPLIARVHIGSFPDSALAKLGSAIVELYNLWQLTGSHPKVLATGAFVDDVCAGFSFSGVCSGHTSGYLQENKMLLIRGVLRRPHLVFNPLFFKRLREGVRMLLRFCKSKKTDNNPLKKAAPASFRIFSIAVAESYQKHGIGQLLMQNLEQKRFVAVTIRCSVGSPDESKPVRFYEKLDGQKTLSGDSWKGVMIKSLKVFGSCITL